MLEHLRPAATLAVGLALLTGLAYPLAVTGIAGAALPGAAGGSLVRRGDAVVGSALVGQAFAGIEDLRRQPAQRQWRRGVGGASGCGGRAEKAGKG